MYFKGCLYRAFKLTSMALPVGRLYSGVPKVLRVASLGFCF